MTVRAERAEEARATMIQLFPDGFEEVARDDGVELAAYTNGAGEERVREVFGRATGIDVPRDWGERWRRFHRPVRVGPLWVGPPWEEPPADASVVVIDPGRAFGTGSHETTRLCLGFLLDLPRGSLVDVGCGSGVLSVAAAKLGFGPVIALDVDPDAVEVATANVAANGVSADVRLVDAFAGPVPAADVALANISRADVERLGPFLNSGLLVASGYLEAERPSLPGLRAVERRVSEGWAADLFARETK